MMFPESVQSKIYCQKGGTHEDMSLNRHTHVFQQSQSSNIDIFQYVWFGDQNDDGLGPVSTTHNKLWPSCRWENGVGWRCH